MKAAAIGIGVLDGAVKTVSGIIGDMDTTIMFASAGTLNADNDGEEFAGNVWKTIKLSNWGWKFFKKVFKNQKILRWKSHFYAAHDIYVDNKKIMGSFVIWAL